MKKDAVRTSALFAAGKDSEMAKNNSKQTGRTERKNNGNEARMKRRQELAFYDKYLISVAEASTYFHIGDKKMYELVHQYEGAKWQLMIGTRRMIKKDMFARWLDAQSEI